MPTWRSCFPTGRLLLLNNYKIVAEEKYITGRLVCSDSGSGHVRVRRKAMSKDERTQKVKTFVQQYIQQFPGKFPTFSLVKKEVGGNEDILRKAVAELKINLKTSQDQIQSADVNEGVLEALKSVAPKNMSIDSKSDDATVMESNDTKQMASSNSVKISEIGLPNNRKQALSQSLEKESIAPSFPDGSLLPTLPTNLYGENLENNAYEGKCSTAPAFPKELSGTNLPDNQERTSLQSSNEKWKPGMASKKVEANPCFEVYSSVHTKGLPSTSTEPKNLELDKSRGFPVALSTYFDEITVENNANNEAKSSNLEVDKLRRGFPVAASKLGSAWHAQDVTHIHKVENKEEEQGSDVPKNMSLLGRLATREDTGTQTRKLQPTKQLGQDQRNRSSPSTSALLFQITSDDETEDDSDFAAFDYPEPDKGDSPVISRTNARVHMLGLSEMPQNQWCLLVMFLPCSATAYDLRMAFEDCGSISEAHIIQSRREECRFNYASIIFKTEEAFRKALMKKDVVVSGGDVVMKAASLSNPKLCQDFAPRAVENIAVPLTEIKKPNCTVMIKDLPHGLSFKHLKNALAFCGTVSRFLMGSSYSIIYVEFETDDAKEKALVAHWICIGGQQLQIRRVETPRSPVVRISNVSSETGDTKVLNICESFGRVKRVDRRDKDIVDVYFIQTELGGMLRILDSLNGVIMNQCRWQAQSAPVFPPETLQSLWSSADGKEYLHSVIQNIFRDINKSCFIENDVNELATQYYRETTIRTKQLDQNFMSYVH